MALQKPKRTHSDKNSVADHEFWPNLDPDPRVCHHFGKNVVKIKNFMNKKHNF